MRLRPTKLVCPMRLAAAHTEQRPPVTRTDGDRAAGRSAPLNNGQGREKSELRATKLPGREAVRGELWQETRGSEGGRSPDMSQKTLFNPG